MRFPAPSLILSLAVFAPVVAAEPLDDAVALYTAGKYAEAKLLLERIALGEPKNAKACYYLGMALRQQPGAAALNSALPWLQKASELEPTNADYLSDFGAALLQLAAARRSWTAAAHGRDAMEKALRLDPSDIDTRHGLFEFYLQAPWPLGSRAKAAAHLAEIAKLDRVRAVALRARLEAEAHHYETAFQLCEEQLAKNSTDYGALYEFGHTSALSGQRLEQGLQFLQQARRLPPPSPAFPSTADIWRQIAIIEEKRGDRSEARAAHEAVLALEPEDDDAIAARQRLK